MAMIAQTLDHLLKQTARSFYLTIHALPETVRWPITIAYLLARATDSVADEVKLPVTTCSSTIRGMFDAVQSNQSAKDLLKPVLSAFPETTGEQLLLTDFDLVITAFSQLDVESKQNILEVFGHIVQGQCLELETFDKKSMQCISTAKELDHYTYLVAGCVGEFWTKLCFSKIPNYSQRSLDELRPLAIRFGQGLQLTNILRDLPRDIAHYRCFLPLDEIKARGMHPMMLQDQLNELAPIVAAWRNKAVRDLQAGWQYMLHIEHKTIRSTLAMPLLFGFATLKLLENPRYLSEQKPVKISRRMLALLLMIAKFSYFSTHAFAVTRLLPFHPLIPPSSHDG